MAWQLIYTSAPRGLVAGRSGFCTVARHREIRDGLVTAIERFSQYDRSGRASGAQSPVVYAHRIVRLGGSSYHVLSCTVDAGADYTGRTNHLAHHLICEPAELAKAPSPAEVLRQMEWRRTWTDAPRYFDDPVDLSRFQRTVDLPAKGWQGLTGDAGCAALPLESGAFSGCYWLYPAEAGEKSLLPLVGESLLLLDPPGRNPEKLWQVPFTTYLQSTDHAADFFWRGCWQGSPAGQTAQGARQTLDLTQPRALQAPASGNAELARTGLATAASAPAVKPSPSKAPPPAKAEPKAPAAVDSPELDLATLLANADQAPGVPKRKTIRVPVEVEIDQATMSVLREEPRPRRGVPPYYIIVAGLAVLLLGAGVMGFMLWRDGKVEGFRRELTAKRNSGDLAGASDMAAHIGSSYREALKAEIDQATVAAELDSLKNGTAAEASDYLNRNQARLGLPGIQGDFAIAERLKRIKAWTSLDAAEEKLRDNVRTDSLDPLARGQARELSARFAGIRKDLDTLDPLYQPSAVHKLHEIGRVFVQGRLAALKKRAPIEKDTPLALEVDELAASAKRYEAGPAVEAQIQALRGTSAPETSVGENPPHKTHGPPAMTPPKVKPPEVAPHLPLVTTYVAFGTATAFDLSNVKEIAAGWPKDKDGKGWLLFRTLEPPVDPPAAAGEECFISGKLLYDGASKPFVTLDGTQLALKTTGNAGDFLLRFTAAGDAGFQIYFIQSEQKSEALVRLPVRWLTHVSEPPTILLDPSLVAALNRIKFAAGGEAKWSFEAANHKLQQPLGSSGKVNLAPMLKELDQKAVAGARSEGETQRTKETRVNAALKARERLLVKGDRPSLADAGFALFDKPGDGMTEGAQLASVENYFKLSTDSGPNSDRFMNYTVELLKKFQARIGNEIAAIKAASTKLDSSKPDQNSKDNELTKKQNELSSAATVAAKLVKDCSDAANAHKLAGAKAVWQSVPKVLEKYGSLNEFREKWALIFSESNINAVYPYLEWKEGDLDTAALEIAKMKEAPAPPKNAWQTLAEKAHANFLKLTPFSVEMKGASGNAVHVLLFEGKSNEGEPPDAGQ